MSLKTFYLERFGFTLIISYKITSVEQNEKKTLYKNIVCVGITTRAFGTRVAEHAGFTFRTGVPLTSPLHLAVRDHSELCSTNVDINNFKVLANASSEIDLKILESLHIFKSRPGLN